MRDLAISEKNIMIVHDSQSGTDLELHYRTVTAEERVQYSRELVKQQGGKVKNNVIETRQRWGKKIIAGFKEGDFGFDGKAVSSDPASDKYRADWKECVAATASDVLEALAQAVFEGTFAKGFPTPTDEGEDLPL